MFTSLLKLYKFGDVKDFIDGLKQGLVLARDAIPLVTVSPKKKEGVVRYSSIAKHNDKNKPTFTIKLLDCEN